MSTIKIRTKRVDDGTLIRMLITHPMETGRRKDDASGQVVPAHFIRSVRIEHNDRLIASCDFSTAVSRDPYLSVQMRGGKSGDRIKVTWEDNLGGHDSHSALIE